MDLFYIGGAAIGAITGAIKGHTTETGLSHGFVIGAVAGAITGVQLMDLIANGEPFSKVMCVYIYIYMFIGSKPYFNTTPWFGLKHR